MEIARGNKQAQAFLLMPMVFMLFFAACTESREVAVEGKLGNEGQVNTWCIAKPLTNDFNLLDNIDYCCKQDGVDCSLIAELGICYEPINLVSHASVVMNLYYRAVGKHHWNCYFNGTGLTITNDPSVGTCLYPL